MQRLKRTSWEMTARGTPNCDTRLPDGGCAPCVPAPAKRTEVAGRTRPFWYRAPATLPALGVLVRPSLSNLTGPMDQPSSGHIQVYWIRGRDEVWYFRLMGEDGKTVMGSYSYASQQEMEEAIAWVRANAARVETLRYNGRPSRPPANRRRPQLSLSPGWIFVLPDDNGKVVLISRPCDSEPEAEEAMAWVKAVAPHAEVRIENPPTSEYEAWRRRPRQIPWAHADGDPRFWCPLPFEEPDPQTKRR